MLLRMTRLNNLEQLLMVLDCSCFKESDLLTKQSHLGYTALERGPSWFFLTDAKTQNSTFSVPFFICQSNLTSYL